MERDKKQYVIYQIPENEERHFIFSYREISKSGKPRYYLFNLTSELILSAELYRSSSGVTAIFSTDSTNFSDKISTNPEYIGFFSNSHPSPTTYAYLNYDKEHSISIRHLRTYEKKINDRIFEISISRIPQFSIKQIPTKEYLSQNHLEQNESDKNFIFGYRISNEAQPKIQKETETDFFANPDFTECFSIIRNDTVFDVIIKYPLNIFEGFAIALSAFIKVKGETNNTFAF